MCYLEIDEQAKKYADQSGLQPCPYTPIAALDEATILKYIGRITCVLSTVKFNNALIVEIDNLPEINRRLPIWELEESRILHNPKQLWVHVDYRLYRNAYTKAFPDEDISSLVIDHVMNRRLARVKGFKYVRVVPISRSANSSSGSHVEKMAIKYNLARLEAQKQDPCFVLSKMSVQCADLADIVKMLNISTGDEFLDPVNEAQKLVDEPDSRA